MNKKEKICSSKRMLVSRPAIVLLVVLLLSISVWVLGSDTNISQTDPFYQNTLAAQHIEVSNYSVNPTILMPGDIATVTILLTNTGDDLGVGINSASLYSDDIKVMSDNYGKVGSIGPSNSMPFTFSIQAGLIPGIYYPVFSTEFRGTYFLRFPIKVTVQDIPLDIAVYSVPETWEKGKRNRILLHLGNRRDNEITGIMVYPNSSTQEVLPSSYVVGSLQPDETCEIPFNITTPGDGDVLFTVQYKNGINLHNVTCTLPVRHGDYSKQADLFLSNVMAVNGGKYILVKGDVSNSGMETANGVVITAKKPAIPVFPNREYGVGNLKPSEFSNFQISFEVPENFTEVPILSTFRDNEGRIFSKETNLTLDPDILMPIPVEPENGLNGEIIPGTGITLPVLGIICIVCVAIVCIYLRRRGGTRFIRMWKKKTVSNPGSDPESVSSPPPELPQISRGENNNRSGLFREGMNYYEEKKFRQAAEVFNRIISEDDTNHRAWNAMGICLTRLGEYESAAQCYRNALSLEPDNGSYARNNLINENKREKMYD